jgi:hypothetical protein
MLLKTKYCPPRICVDVGSCKKSTICGQIYVLENLTSANHVDLVGACIYATKGRSRNINLWGTYLRYSDCQQIFGS